MSESKDPTPSPATPTTPSPVPAPKAKSSTESASAAGPPQRKGKWPRRILRTLIVVVVLLLAFRVAIAIAFPAVLSRVAGQYGLNCTYERSQMNLLSGDAELWYLTFTPKDGGDPVLKAEYCRGNLSTLNLLRGRFAVWRLEADGVDLAIDREADGSIPLLERFTSSTPAQEPGKPLEKIDFTSPLRLDALRLSHVRARIRDRAVTPATDQVVNLDLRVSDVGSQGRPTRFLVELRSDPLMDLMLVRGTATAQGKTLDADVDVAVRGLHPKQAAAYLEPLGIRPVASDVDLTCVATVKTQPAPGGAEAVLANVVMRDISAVADGREAAAVDRISLSTGPVGLASADLGELHIDGVRGAAQRTEAGAIRVAGFELGGAGAEVAAAPQRTGPAGGDSIVLVSTPTSAPSPAAARSGYRVSLGQIRVSNVHAAFEDAAVSPVANLAFDLSNLTMTTTAAADGKPARAEFVADFTMPGLIRAGRVEGSTSPDGEGRTADLTLKAQGMLADAIEPYLHMAGLESSLKDAQLECALTAQLRPLPGGAFSADAVLHALTFSDGGELLALRDSHVKGFTIDSDTGMLRAESIELSGPSLAVQRRADGELQLLGLRTRRLAGGSNVAAAQASAPPKAEPAAPADGAVALPRFEIGRFVWKDVKLQLEDATVTPPTTIAIDDAGVEVRDLLVDLQSANATRRPGTFRAWAAAPGVAERFEASGSITPAPRSLAVDVNVAGEGLNATALKPYLQPLGVEPTLQQGSLKLAAKVSMVEQEVGLVASADVRDLSYADAGTELIGLDALAVRDAQLRAGELVVGEIDVKRPRAAAARRKDGALAVAGVLFRPANASSPPTAPPADARATVPATQPVIQPATGAAAGPAFAAVLQRLRVEDASAEWTDEAVDPPLKTTARARLELDDLVVGREAAPASIDLAMKLDGIIDRMDVKGDVQTSPQKLAARLDISGAGVRGEALRPYLPPGTVVSLADGRFRTSFDATVSQHPDGGLVASVLVKDTDLRDGEAGESLFALGNLSVRVSRLDPAGKVIAIDQLSTEGIETALTLEPNGAIRVAGLILEPAPAQAQAGAAEEAAAPTTAPADPSAPPADAAALARRGIAALPLFTLESLDLRLDRLTVTDASRPTAEPLVLRDLRLRNLERVEMAGPEPESRPPAKLQLSLTADPVVRLAELDMVLAPFAAEPLAQLDLSVQGIRGDGLTRLVPELAEKIDGSGMTDGRFDAQLEALLRIDRQLWQDLNFSRRFGADVVVKDVAFRSTPDGPVLAGVQELRGDDVEFDPSTGALAVKALEITKPSIRAMRDDEGLHALGLTFKLPAGAAGEAAATQDAPGDPSEVEPSLENQVNGRASIATSEQEAASAAAAAAKPQAEIRIDRLLVSGLDARLEDRTVEPATVVPLTAMDLDVRGLSNMVLYEERPIRFSLLVGSGKVSLPVDRKAARAAAGGEQGTAERELFAQITADGRLALYPHPKGWVKSSVSGLDLTGLRGPASAAQVDIGNGVFDSDVNLRFAGNGDLKARSKFTFTDLRISEPPNGPIQRSLGIRSPLDVVIVALQGADGAINVPVNVTLPGGEISGGKVAGAAAGAAASVITTAVASAPIKAASTVGNIVGIPGLKREKQAFDPVEFAFLAGDTSIDPRRSRALDELAELMRRDRKMTLTLRHELGAGDIARAGVRANPDEAEARNLAYRLRLRKFELQRQRAAVAGRAQGQLVSGLRQASDTSIDELRAIDREIVSVEDALDGVYELLRPGADRQASRRTRSAAIDLGRQRLETVRAALLARGIDDPGRIRITNPQFTEPESPDDADSGGSVLVTVVAGK